MTTDCRGADYRTVLERLHAVLQPRTYLEIGTEHGVTLALSRCATIAVDPAFRLGEWDFDRAFSTKPALHLYRMASDQFFAAHDPKAVFGAPVELAFLDGMHRCEFLLRDFVNTERHCRRGSVVVLHDCFPPEPGIAARAQAEATAADETRRNWWTGDVWRTALLLKRRRPDLHITAIDAFPTGLVLITNLDPDSRILGDAYPDAVREMFGWSLEDDGLARYFAEMGITPAEPFLCDDEITARFWLGEPRSGGA